MKILTSNDDGVHALGNKSLRERLKVETGHDILTLAPDRERSSCGHAITLGEPVRLNYIDKNVYSCSGFPADCILLALGNFYEGTRPDLVISGINMGANLGQDRYYSGTIAAAREASFRGIPSIAISQVIHSSSEEVNYDKAINFVLKLISKDIHRYIPRMTLLNINIPNNSENKNSKAVYCTTGYQKYSEEIVKRVDTRGRNYFWVGGNYHGHENILGSDCNVIDAGNISVSLEDLTGRNDIDPLVIEKLISLI